MAKKLKKEIEELLRCELTEDELKQIGEKLAKNVQEKTRLENAKKAMMADYKAKIDSVNADIVQGSNRIKDKCEDRMIICTKEYDFSKFTIKITRTDTGEIVSERAMTLSEKTEETLFEE